MSTEGIVVSKQNTVSSWILEFNGEDLLFGK